MAKVIWKAAEQDFVIFFEEPYTVETVKLAKYPTRKIDQIA